MMRTSFIKFIDIRTIFIKCCVTIFSISQVLFPNSNYSSFIKHIIAVISTGSKYKT